MNQDICPSPTVDTWEKELVEGEKITRDKYKGKDVSKRCKKKRTLVILYLKMEKNKANIKQRTNKAHGNVNKIVTTVNERPYGRHFFKAIKLMRESILLKKILSTAGNPCTVFMQLEMGVISVKFVIMQKRMNFLHYILNESMDSMIRQVYNTLKEDSRKGDFVFMSDNDREELKIDKTDEDIAEITKNSWKKYVKERVMSSALEYLSNENSKKEKKQNIYCLKNWK